VRKEREELVREERQKRKGNKEGINGGSRRK
jgi:hypothetical protein